MRFKNTMKKKKHSRVLFLEREKINMRPEILAPVGNREALEAAIAAGCDAVYFGLPVFGARAYAKNFSLEETEEIIKKCHLLNIKVYITMNTVSLKMKWKKLMLWQNVCMRWM